jgi:hypothetical protein
MQFGSFFYAQGICRAARVDLCVPHGFGRVDIADSCHTSLIEEELFEWAA